MTGDVPLVKYPAPQVPQVWLIDERTAGAVQVVQLVSTMLQVRQFELQAKQVTGEVPLVKNPAPQVPQVLFAPKRVPVAQDVQFVETTLQVRHGAVH